MVLPYYQLMRRCASLYRYKGDTVREATGELKVRIDKSFPLREAAEAHRQLEGRKTKGKVLLIP